MTFTIKELIRDISRIDQEDLLSAWQWKFTEPMTIIMISNLGDLFLENGSGEIYWLLADGGDFQKVADSRRHFENLLQDNKIVDDWLLPGLVEKILTTGVVLKKNEVYSPKTMTVLGGSFDPTNFSPTDMSVHFHFAGVISEKIKDIPDGTPVKIRLTK